MRASCACTATTAGRDSTSGRVVVVSRMKSRNCCSSAMTYSPTTADSFPATHRAGGWATGESGPDACEGGGVADERPFGDLPRGHFGAVLADPPWKYVTYSERGQGRSASRHYEVMMFEEIATLPVRDLAAPDAWLFLWVPSPHLPFGFQLIERWGFRYSGKAFAWAKQNPSGVGWHMGTGFTTRKNSEDCLLGRRGRPPIKAQDVRELIVAPRRKHSQKPDEQYARIERLVDGPYVELFARQRRSGWHYWGNETDKFELQYDAQDDFAKSLEEGYRAIRERVAAGGAGWEPK